MFNGKVIKVVEELKKEIINEIKTINLKDKDFESYGVDEIQTIVTRLINYINLLYQDIIVGKLNYNDKIMTKLYIDTKDYNDNCFYDYEIMKDKEK